MPQQRIFYEFINGKLMPYIYVLTFGVGDINWEHPTLAYEAIKPFRHDDLYEFDDSILTTTILFSDFIFNLDHPNRFKLNLKRIKKRIEWNGVDPNVISQFVLGTYDLQELLIFLPKERKIDFVMN